MQKLNNYKAINVNLNADFQAPIASHIQRMENNLNVVDRFLSDVSIMLAAC